MPDYSAELAELMPETTTIPRQGVGINVRRLLKLRGPLMAMIFTALFVPAVALILLFVPKFYLAGAELEFKEVRPGILDSGDSGQRSSYESYVNTQIRYIEGYALRKAVLEDPDVRQNTDLATRDDALQRLVSSLEASFIPNTELVGLSYKDEDREDAVLILDTVVQKYMDYVQEQETSSGGIKRRTLTEKEDELSKRLEELRARLVELRKSAGIAPGETGVLEPAEAESYRLQLASAESDLAAAESNLRLNENQLEQVNQKLGSYESEPNNPIYSLGIEERVLQHPAVVLLTEQLAQVQQELTVLEDRYVDEAPQLRVKRRERDVLAEKVDSVEAGVRGEMLNVLKAQVEVAIDESAAARDAAQSRAEQLRALLNNLRQESIEKASDLAEIDKTDQQIAEVNAQLDQVREELFQLEVESNAPARVEIASGANAEQQPSQRDRIKFLLVALLGCFSIALFTGVALESTDQNIRSGEDVAYVSSLPLLSSIPHTAEDRLPAQVNAAMLTAEHPNTLTADEFRRTVARILNSPGLAGEARSVLVVSPARGDGKTTLAANLAIVLAQADRRVLLVDVDSRNPGIERAFGLRHGPGLAEMLLGEELPHDPDQATEFENLFVLGPGLRSSGLVERLASREMREFLAGAEDIFDHVIIDTPASLLMSEARLVAPMVDGVVVVVGAGISTFGMLRRCLRILDDVGGKLLGIVVNGVRHSPLGYLKGNLDQYYASHGSAAAGPRTIPPRPRSREASIVLVGDEDRGR
ncbi:MAG: AAA family ATPase [Candidatus Hydrogenedentes bacterium]|nr:AAA family ATPase [Candidatus Hydrogenedentota bacterium]